jgi:hypothetical protein
MKPRNLLLLAVLAVGLSVAAIRASRTSVTRTDDQIGEKLFVGLLERTNEITEIEISGGVGEPFTVRRSEDGSGWGVADRGGYPAKPDNVKSALVGVAQLERVEPKTARTDRWHMLGLAETEDASPIRLVLRDGSGATAADLLLGDSPERRGQDLRFVRRSDEDRVWLVEGRVDVLARRILWMDTKLAEFERERIESATTTHPDGETFRVYRRTRKSTEWFIEDLPEGRDLATPTAAQPIGTGLAWVNFEDVAPAGDVDLTDPVVCLFRAFDGLEVTVRSVEVDGAWWSTLEAAYVPEDIGPGPAPQDTVVPEPEEIAALEEEVHDLNERLGPWVFKLGQYKAGVFTKRLDDLLADLPEIEEEPEPEVAEEPPAAETAAPEEPEEPAESGVPEALERTDMPPVDGGIGVPGPPTLGDE